MKRNESKEWARERARGVFFGNTSPFTEDLSRIDEAALRRNLRHDIALGANGIGYGGPLAEPFTLSIAERKRGHEILAEEAQRGGVVSYGYPVSDSIPETIELAKHAADVGVDLLMLNVPYEWTKTDDMIFEFFELVSNAAGDIGIMMYNTPHAGYILPLELQDRIADLPNVCVRKDGRNFEESAQALERLGDRIVVSGGGAKDWPRWAAAGFQLMSPSSTGYLLQTKSWQPINEMYQLTSSGKMKEAQAVCDKIKPLTQTRLEVYAKTFHGRTPGREEHPDAGVKYYEDLIGMAGGPVRRPTTPFPPEARDWLEHELEGHIASGLLKLDRINRPLVAARA